MIQLAYLFWHWPRAEVSPGDYEDRLASFHAALAAGSIPGYEGSWSFAVTGLPWANAGAAAYEDWYLLRDSAALDPLNEAAVAGRRQAAHDAAAAMSEGGAGGLLRLRLGVPAPAPRVAVWFSKAAGMPYAALWERLGPTVDRAGGALWGRQMVLGPSPEFCLHAPAPVVLPAPFVSHATALRRIGSWDRSDRP